MLVTREGMSIRFDEKQVRTTGRVSQGVKGISMKTGDEVIGMVIPDDPENETLLIVTEKGFGKRTSLESYRIQNRGGKGLSTYRITEKTGLIAGARSVTEDNEVLLINTDGTIIRMKVNEIRVIGRSTSGVRLMKMDEGSRIVGMARAEASESEHEELLCSDLEIEE